MLSEIQKFKFVAHLEENANKTHRFSHAPMQLPYLFITYLLITSILVPVKYFFVYGCRTMTNWRSACCTFSVA